MKFRFIGALICIFFALPVFSQQLTTGSIVGRTIDKDGNPLPGVEVTISSPALIQAKQSMITRPDGSFAFRALPPGVYKIECKLQGFKTLIREGIQVRLGAVVTLTLTMEISPIEETVVVTGESPVVDVQSSRIQISITSDFLQSLPTSRDIWVTIAYSPGVYVSRYDVGGNTTGTQTGYTTYGLSDQNRPLIEGVDTTEGTGGSGFYFDFSAIEEVNLQTFGADAERKVPGLTYLMLVKSGGNEFHGEIYGDYQSENFAKRTNIDDELREKGVTAGTRMKIYYDLHANLGGRIIKDKLWFFISARRQAAAKYVVGYYLPDGKQGDDYTLLPSYTGKLTWQISKKDRLEFFTMISGKYFPQRGGSAYCPVESTSTQDSPQWAIRTNYTRMFSEKFYIEANMGHFGYDWSMRPADKYGVRTPAGRDLATGKYFGQQAAWYGTTLAADWILKRRRYQFNLIGNAYIGLHEFRFGFEVLNEIGKRRINGFPGSVYHFLWNGTPLYVELMNTPIRSDDRLRNYSAFLQDTWRLGRKLVLNFGVRFEAYESYRPEQRSPQGRFAPERVFSAMHDIINWNSLAPRLGLVYDLTRKGKMPIKIFFGRYYHNPGIYPSEASNPVALEFRRHYWNDINKNGYYDPGEEGALISVTGGTRQRIDPNLTQPYTDEYGISIERELIPDLGLRVGYLVKDTHNLMQVINVAWPYEAFNIPVTKTDPGRDGILGTADDRPLLLYNLDPAYKGKSDNLLTNKGAKSRADNIEFVLTKRMSRGWMAMASFTATHLDEHRLASSNGIEVAVDPNSEILNKVKYWRWSGKLAMTLRLPWDIYFSLLYEHSRGTPYGRRVQITGLNQGLVTIWAEPYGSSFTEPVNLVNFNFLKQIKVYKSHTLEFRLQVFNVFNHNSIISVDSITRPGYPRILEILPPRIARLGFTYKF